jgi:hypothetical protein
MSLLMRVLAVLALASALPLAAQVTFSSTTYPAPSNSYQGNSVAADIDRDGNPDMLTTDAYNPQVLIWYGIGGGKFGSPEVVGNLDGIGQNIAVGDFNGDGKLDFLVTIGSNPYAVDILTNDGSRTFSKSTISMSDVPQYLVVADFNNDGKLDFAVSCYSIAIGNYIRIYTGNGNGTFTPGAQLLQSQGTYYLMAADLNKDGKIDIVNVSAPATIFLNAGNATFTAAQEISVPNGGTYVWGSIGDLNADAAPDLFLTNNQFCGEGCGWIKSLDAYLNDGTGHFTLSSSLQPTGSSDESGVLADLNYDGNLDMAFGSDNELEYALGKGKGTFQTVETAGPLNGQYSDSQADILAHDLNNDGLLDLASIASGSMLIELNTSAKPDCLPPNSASLGTTACSPVSGQTVNSTFPVRAAANGPVDILRIEEWVDGKKLYQNLSNQVRNNLTLGSGSHSVSIVSVDVLGGISKNNFSIHVSPCTAPPSPGVQICTPASGATVTSPVSVVAAATPVSGTHITAMRVYVDNVAKYTQSGASLSASVPMSSGSHVISVVGYESNGSAQKATDTIIVH